MDRPAGDRVRAGCTGFPGGDPMKEIYNPQKQTAIILDRAYQLIKSVPYQVSARWLFYRLLQEGFYFTKQDYSNKFLKAISAARRSFYRDWTPYTLADETRAPIIGGDGWKDGAAWLKDVARAQCKLDKWHAQPVYLECWYEARAMTDQFRHYTKHVTLRPMGGQPSIPYKWQIAKDLEEAAQEYGKPIKILYFGDLDPAGETISETIKQDVTEWSAAPFEFIHCGLTAEQVQRYNVPENVEHPGAYQWEALTDNAADEIITGNLDRFWRHDALTAMIEREAKVSQWLADTITGLIGDYQE
jgi:hypothetical protein